MVSASDIYTEHHSKNKRRGTTVLGDLRGSLLRTYIGRGKNVLDLGCRDGSLTETFFEGNTVLGVDVDVVALDEARTKLGIETKLCDLHGDWSELGSQTFDVIVAGEILEHLYFPEKIVAKAHTRLSTKGVFIGTVPNAFSLKNRLRLLFLQKKNTPLADPTHINHFTVSELRKILSAHFSSVEIIGIGNAGFLAKALPQLFAFDLFFVAKK